MLPFFIAVIGLLVFVAVVLLVMQRSRLRRMSVERLEDEEQSRVFVPDVIEATGVLTSLRRHYIFPWFFGLLLAASLIYLLKLPTIFCVAFGIICVVITTIFDGMRVNRVEARLMTQLAEAIDLMVGALRAGMGATDALERATAEAKKPLREIFGQFLGRLKLGEDPQIAVRTLQDRVPIESYRLFGATLSVHWEIGGSLGPTLSGVGRTIRDRVEITRKIRGQTTQARASVLVILLVTYLLGFMTWRGYPDRVEGFLGSNVGRILASGAMLMQTMGVLWISKLSKIRY